MSMNFYISAKREILIVGTGETDYQWERFDVWQTPTNVSYSLLNSENPIESYINWVNERGKTLIREVPVYDPNDIFCEGEPIGTELYDPAKEHIDELRKWLTMIEKGKYKLEFEVS